MVALKSAAAKRKAPQRTSREFVSPQAPPLALERAKKAGRAKEEAIEIGSDSARPASRAPCLARARRDAIVGDCDDERAWKPKAKAPPQLGQHKIAKTAMVAPGQPYKAGMQQRGATGTGPGGRRLDDGKVVYGSGSGQVLGGRPRARPYNGTKPLPKKTPERRASPPPRRQPSREKKPGGAPHCRLDCKRAYFGTELHFGAGLVITEQAINMEWKSQLTGNYRTVAIQARDIESMAYKTQDDADAGPIDLCGDDAPADLSDGGPVVKFLALTLDKNAWVGNTLSRERFDPSQNPGPHCRVVLDLAGSAARVFTDDVLGFLYDNYSHATINLISGADTAAPYLLGVTDADAMEKRRRAKQNEAEPAAAAPRGGSKRKRGAAPAHVNLVDDPANAEPAFTFPSAKAPDAITCLKGDRLRLQDGEFLNDNLINLYLKNKMHNQLASVVSVHVFSTFFFTKMLEAEAFPGSFDAKKAYAKVKRWTKNVDVFDQDLLFVPVNEHLHWSLAVVVNPGKKPSRRTPRAPKPKPKKGDVIEIDSDSDGDGDDADATPDPSEPYILAMDSLRSHDKGRIAEYLRAFLKCAWADRHASRDLDGRFEAETMPIFAPDLPKQRNSFDCGVYVLKFFDLLFDKPLPARAADDDMTFGDRFSKQLFKREDVKAKRAKLLHFFDLEWEKAMRAKEAELPEAKAPEAADDDDVADSDATESMPDARAADAATASDDLAGALVQAKARQKRDTAPAPPKAKAQAPPRQSFRDGASMPDCLPPAKRQKTGQSTSSLAGKSSSSPRKRKPPTPPASDDEVYDDDFDEEFGGSPPPPKTIGL
ncbi:small ubiquitin-like modifier deconjugating peptidase [Aureococcus anophagefferens]|uniref:Small ubiquitin-like modifier deconjugating peptidase n=1 Tax=Aureococcus anophagefferens TaxID=44056 RepID=A0ABR1G5N5_AURAN